MVPNYKDRASFYAQQYGLDPSLYSNVINQESRWNPQAVSPVGAEGLAQIMPDTGRQPGFGVTPVKNAKDPEDSLRFGAEYLSKMMERYDGDEVKALAAYNWGAGNVDKWDGDPAKLPAETRDYITKIRGNPSAKDGGYGGGQGMLPMEVAMSSRGDDSGALTMTDEPKGLWGKFNNWRNEGQNRDRLLAISAGLLSGDDWASGIGNAASGVLAVNQDERANEDKDDLLAQRKAQVEADADYRERVLAQRMDEANQPGKRYSAGMYEFEDPETGETMTVNAYSDTAADGLFYQDENENRTPLPGTAQRRNNSTISGDKGVWTGKQWEENSVQLVRDGNTVEAMDRALGFLETSPKGLELLAQDADRIIKNLTGQGLDIETIDTQQLRGEIQRMIGQNRLDVVGGGVMTEQDALRIITALGGDMQSYLNSDPETQMRLLKQLREDRMEAYDQSYSNAQTQYERHGERYGYGAMPERYTPPEVTTTVLPPPPGNDPTQLPPLQFTVPGAEDAFRKYSQ